MYMSPYDTSQRGVYLFPLADHFPDQSFFTLHFLSISCTYIWTFDSFLTFTKIRLSSLDFGDCMSHEYWIVIFMADAREVSKSRVFDEKETKYPWLFFRGEYVQLFLVQKTSDLTINWCIVAHSFIATFCTRTFSTAPSPWVSSQPGNRKNIAKGTTDPRVECFHQSYCSY